MSFKNQIEYWNSVADNKIFTTTLNLSLIEKYIKYDSFILDYGCGYGRILNELYNNGYKNLVGIDYSENMILKGKNLHPYLNLKTCIDSKIEFPDNSVDTVILFAVLTCIIDNEKQVNLIKDIHRILKPGGIIYINDFLINTDDRNILRYKKYMNKYGLYGVFELEEGAVLRHHTELWFIELLKYFKNLHFEKIKFKTMNNHVSNGIIIIAKK